MVNARNSYIDKNKNEIVDLVLKPEDYIINGDRIKKNLNFEIAVDIVELATNKEICNPAFMTINMNQDTNIDKDKTKSILIFGEYFLRRYYTVFDRDRNVIGFSLANHKSNNENINKINTPYDEIDNYLNVNHNFRHEESRNIRNTKIVFGKHLNKGAKASEDSLIINP